MNWRNGIRPWKGKRNNWHTYEEDKVGWQVRKASLNEKLGKL